MRCKNDSLGLLESDPDKTIRLLMFSGIRPRHHPKIPDCLRLRRPDSNCQGKDFSESGKSKDVSKTHAECYVVHVSGSNVENQQCSVVKKAIQEKKACIAKKRNWNDEYIACEFYRTKGKMLNPDRSARALFCTTVIGNSNLVPGHLEQF